MTSESSSGMRVPELQNVQGNLVGFNKDHQRFVFLQFPDQAGGRAFLGDLEPDLANAWEVLHFNSLFKEIHKRRGAARDILRCCWTNLALTVAGLGVLGASELESLPADFRDDMAERAKRTLGDVDDSDPANWQAQFTTAPHAVAIIGADTPEDLRSGYGRLQAKCQAHGVIEPASPLDGNTRPDPNRGREHFGFKDGISQPGIARITQSSKRGQDTVATGEFLIGYPNQDGQISGQQTPPQPGSPGYDPNTPTPSVPPLPAWTKDGSFIVFRRLRQNVQAFNDFLAQQAALVGGDQERLAAKLVGRWRSGAPLEMTHDEPEGFDPSVKDPSLDDPSILSDRKVNNFDYEPQDADGHLVPRAAHIRKVNPRNEQPPGKDVSNRHRILRRGIPYGPEFQPGEPPYPGGPTVPDTQDRGLLFLCYQASIERGFEFIQTAWANDPGFPQPEDGRDPIISQDVAERDFRLSVDNPHVAMQRWVQTTGSLYLFAPSIEAIREQLI